MVKNTCKKGRKKKKSNVDQENKKVRDSKEEEGQLGYIHVRARRGQATDSHSLAERVLYLYFSSFFYIRISIYTLLPISSETNLIFSFIRKTTLLHRSKFTRKRSHRNIVRHQKFKDSYIFL